MGMSIYCVSATVETLSYFHHTRIAYWSFYYPPLLLIDIHILLYIYSCQQQPYVHIVSSSLRSSTSYTYVHHIILCCCSLTDWWKRIRTAHRRLRPSPRTRCSCTTYWTSRWFFCTIHKKWCELNRNMFMKLTMFNVYAHVGTCSIYIHMYL